MSLKNNYQPQRAIEPKLGQDPESKLPDYLPLRAQLSKFNQWRATKIASKILKSLELTENGETVEIPILNFARYEDETVIGNPELWGQVKLLLRRNGAYAHVQYPRPTESATLIDYEGPTLVATQQKPSTEEAPGKPPKELSKDDIASLANVA